MLKWFTLELYLLPLVCPKRVQLEETESDLERRIVFLFFPSSQGAWTYSFIQNRLSELCGEVMCMAANER